MNKYKEIVAIWWKDSAYHGFEQREEKDVAENYGTLLILTVGILIKEDKGKLTVVQDWFPQQQPELIGMEFKDNQVRSPSTIPKVSVVKIRRYKISI